MQNTSEYAVGWFTLSLINAGLAEAKGMSRLNWWIGSLFFGPLCTLFLVVSDGPKPKPRAGQ
jgi:purine-cytosine permease-like protein